MTRRVHIFIAVLLIVKVIVCLLQAVSLQMFFVLTATKAVSIVQDSEHGNLFI